MSNFIGINFQILHGLLSWLSSRCSYTVSILVSNYQCRGMMTNSCMIFAGPAACEVPCHVSHSPEKARMVSVDSKPNQSCLGLPNVIPSAILLLIDNLDPPRYGKGGNGYRGPIPQPTNHHAKLIRLPWFELRSLSMSRSNQNAADIVPCV